MDVPLKMVTTLVWDSLNFFIILKTSLQSCSECNIISFVTLWYHLKTYCVFQFCRIVSNVMKFHLRLYHIIWKHFVCFKSAKLFRLWWNFIWWEWCFFGGSENFQTSHQLQMNISPRKISSRQSYWYGALELDQYFHFMPTTSMWKWFPGRYESPKICNSASFFFPTR